MKVRGGMLLARALHEKGISRVFTLSGGFCNPALEGLMECGIPVINTPHEQIAGTWLMQTHGSHASLPSVWSVRKALPTPCLQ